MLSGNGFTINDVLETDYETLMEVMGASNKEEAASDDVMSLEDFISTV
ncbi:hypothetical protein [Streptococcus hyointestinalis]|nr:hypothetical protein [Streptococcus hyointestinalis]